MCLEKGDSSKKNSYCSYLIRWKRERMIPEQRWWGAEMRSRDDEEQDEETKKDVKQAEQGAKKEAKKEVRCKKKLTKN